MGVLSKFTKVAADKAGTYMDQGIERTKTGSFLEALAGRGTPKPSPDAQMGGALRDAMTKSRAADKATDDGWTKLQTRRC